jgi:hypothetical protein
VCLLVFSIKTAPMIQTTAQNEHPPNPPTKTRSIGTPMANKNTQRGAYITAQAIAAQIRALDT